MAGKRYLLDCTLRDGGYINDWAFGHDHIVNIFERVIASGVDVIEIGFGTRSVKAEVLSVVETARKEEAQELFRYL